MGYLIYHAPIDASSFNLNELRLTDVEVIGSRIFALDAYQGILHFDYEADRVRSFDIHNLTEFGIDQGYALSLNYDGNYIQLTIHFSS